MKTNFIIQTGLISMLLSISLSTFAANPQCEKLNNTSWNSDFVAVNAGYFHCVYTANVHFAVHDKQASGEMILNTDDKDCQELVGKHHLEGTCAVAEWDFLRFFLPGGNEIRGYFNEDKLNLGGTIQFWQGLNVGIDMDLRKE